MEDMKAIQYLKVTPHEKEGYSKIIQSSSLGTPDVIYEVPNEMVEDVIKEMEQSWKNAMESFVSRMTEANEMSETMNKELMDRLKE